MVKWVSLIFGSCLGGVSRYVVSGIVYQAGGSHFPYGTMVVNLVGCFLIGLLNTLAEEKFLLGPSARLLLMTGFCGAFTTFSTWMLETNNLMRQGETFLALANVVASLLLGFFVFKLGVMLAELI